MNPKLLSLNDAHGMEIDTIHQLYKAHVSSTRVDLLTSFQFGRESVDYAEGVYIYCSGGKRILDFTGGIGVLNHGHNHPRILAARKKFAEERRMEVHKNYFSKYVAALSHNVAALLPGDLSICHFQNSGSEAVDCALRSALKFHDMKRPHILYSNIAFHGKLLSASSVSNSPESGYPFTKLPHTHQFEYDNIASVEELVDSLRDASGRSTIAALIVEPINVSNLRACSESFLFDVRKLCTKNNIILIFDEVYSGWCKAGALFYFMRYPNLVPDILCMAKSFGGGKASISSAVLTRQLSQAYENPADANLPTTTFHGFGEETATAIEAVNIIVDENFPDNALRIEKKVWSRMQSLREKHASVILDYRGFGAIHGIFFKPITENLESLIKRLPGELFKDPRFLSKLTTSAIVSELYSAHDILTFTSLGEDIHLIVSPPLIINDEEIDYFFDCLDSVLCSGLAKLVFKFALQKYIH